MKLDLKLYHTGSLIYMQGAEARHFYIVNRGRVFVHREGMDNRDEGSFMTAGEVFAVAPCLSNKPHFDSAVAEEDTELIRFSKDQFLQLVETNSDVVFKIISSFSRRVRQLTTELAKGLPESMSEGGPLSSSGETLVPLGEEMLKTSQFDLAYYIGKTYQTQFSNGPLRDRAEALVKESQEAASQKIKDYVELLASYGGGNLNVPAGAPLCMEGEKGATMFLVQSGSFKVEKWEGHRLVAVAWLFESDIVGEMALLDKEPRSASVIAGNTESSVLGINEGNFASTMHSRPDIVVGLTALLSKRIWQLQRRFYNKQISALVPRIYDYICFELEVRNIDSSSAQAYDLDLSPKDVTDTFTKIAESETAKAMKDFLEEEKASIVDGHLYINSIKDFFMRHEYYTLREKRRRESQDDEEDDKV